MDMRGVEAEVTQDPDTGKDVLSVSVGGSKFILHLSGSARTILWLVEEVYVAGRRSKQSWLTKLWGG